MDPRARELLARVGDEKPCEYIEFARGNCMAVGQNQGTIYVRFLHITIINNNRDFTFVSV